MRTPACVRSIRTTALARETTGRPARHRRCPERVLTWGLSLTAALWLGLSADLSLSAEKDRPARKLHFPSNRPVGLIHIAFGLQPDWYRALEKPSCRPSWAWEYLCEAKGTVHIPAGAIVKLTLGPHGAKDMSWVTALRPDDLHSLDIRPTWITEGRFGDTEMQPLRHLTGLSELWLFDAPISDRGLEVVPCFTSLKSLWVRSKRANNAGLAHVARLKQLEVLTYTNDQGNDKGLAHFPEMTSLRELGLTIGKASGPGLAHLAKMPFLEHLSIGGDGFGDQHVAYLKDATSLRSLGLAMTNVTDAGVAHLSNLTHLEYLDLWHTGVTDACLLYLKPMRSLKRLNIRVEYPDPKNPPFTIRGIAQLAEMQSLEHLDLPNFGMTDECLALVSKLQNLRYLWVGCNSNSVLSDAGLEHVAKLKRLEQLQISGTGITDKGMPLIASLTGLIKLGLHSAPGVTDDGLVPLKALKSLRILTLPEHCGITLAGLSHLNSLSELRHLHAGQLDPPALGDGVMDVSGLTGLEKITLPDVRDEDLVCLAKLKNLQWLQLSYSKSISDVGMAHLAGLRYMDRLVLAGPNLTDKGLACLAGMKQLNFVRIRGNFTDRGLHHFEGLKGLSLVGIYSNRNFSPQALKALKENLPNLHFFTADKDREIVGTPPSAIRVGQLAPAFKATTLDGKEINLADYRGKVVWLYFWATWCGPCVASTPAMKKSYEKLSEYKDFAMISLSMDDDENRLRQHVERHGLAWPQLRLGSASRVASRYGVVGAPRSVVVGRDGRILYKDGEGSLDATLKKALTE